MNISKLFSKTYQTKLCAWGNWKFEKKIARPSKKYATRQTSSEVLVEVYILKNVRIDIIVDTKGCNP